MKLHVGQYLKQTVFSALIVKLFNLNKNKGERFKLVCISVSQRKGRNRHCLKHIIIFLTFAVAQNPLAGPFTEARATHSNPEEHRPSV